MRSNIAVGFDGGGRRRHFGTMMCDGDYTLVMQRVSLEEVDDVCSKQTVFFSTIRYSFEIELDVC